MEMQILLGRSILASEFSDMQSRIIHLLAEFSQSNHGVLEAAVATSTVLAESGYCTEAWFPNRTSNHSFDFRSAQPREYSLSDLADAIRITRRVNLDVTRTVIVSHGAWCYPTRLAAQLKSLGFRWVYVPHGALEPWSMRHKRFRKSLYWKLLEKRLVRRADVVRATSLPEYESLKRLFATTQLVPNGVDSRDFRSRRFVDKKRILFLGRLHFKKSPVSLVEGWLASSLHNHSEFELVIVGNDDGELPKLQLILAQSPSNILLKSPVYGAEKEELFDSCTFFALPSHSEGLPVALLEAMSSGLIPLISDGCNVPDAFEENIAFRLNPSVDSIVETLNRISQLSVERLDVMGQATQRFASSNYSIEAIAKKQLIMYEKLLFHQSN